MQAVAFHRVVFMVFSLAKLYIVETLSNDPVARSYHISAMAGL
jgi:hypothetical protein